MRRVKPKYDAGKGVAATAIYKKTTSPIAHKNSAQIECEDSKQLSTSCCVLSLCSTAILNMACPTFSLLRSSGDSALSPC
jgi:hypothetical protein